MDLPDNFLLERRPIKHARLRVSEDLRVHVLVPEDFSDDEIRTMLNQKDIWIHQKLRFFENRNSKIHLRKNQIFFLGERYNYFYEQDLGTKVLINQESKTIRSGQNLLDQVMQEKWLRKEARKHIVQRVQALSQTTGLNYHRIFVRTSLTKWGNCSRQMNLSFNWRLIKAPEFVIDYLIAHELAHTKYMNHKNEFWRRLRSIFPETAKAQAWLDKYGHTI